MTTARRWSLFAAGLIVLLCVPFAIGHLPSGSSTVSATTLWRQIMGSAGTAYSGYAEAQGNLQLPVTDEYNSVADLVGGRTQLRVWWRGADQWRVDAVSAFGETDTSHTDGATWTWNYERQRATRTYADGYFNLSRASGRRQDVTDSGPQVRLPSTQDVLPPELARRLLSRATRAELTSLPNRRVAGVSAHGLRLTPSIAASSIATVDVWADPRTGLPLRVEVTGKGAKVAAVTTSLLDYSRSRPATADTDFTPVTRARYSDQVDVASAIDRFAPVQPPHSLAGIARSPSVDGLGAIGIYGRGVSEMIAAPLRGRIADPLRKQLQSTAAPTDDGSVALGIGPLNLLLTAPDENNRSWLLTGTVTAQTLADAAADLAAKPPVEEPR